MISSSSSGRFVVPIGGAGFVPPRFHPPAAHGPRAGGSSSADSYCFSQSTAEQQAPPLASRNARTHQRGGSLPALAMAHAAPHHGNAMQPQPIPVSSAVGAGMLLAVTSPSSSISGSSVASGSFSTTPSPNASPVIPSGWQARQNAYASAMYMHTSRMWQDERKAMERAALQIADAAPMHNSSMIRGGELNQRFAVPARTSSPASGSQTSSTAGHRRTKSLKNNPSSQAGSESWLGRAKSLKRFAGLS